jgi:peptidylprolyl isomerase
MRQYWFLFIGLIPLVLVAGCTTSPPPSPASTPTQQIIPSTVAKTGDTVFVYYVGTLDDGTLFDTNVNATPLEFTLGNGMVIPGFETAVLGMGVNGSKTVVIPYQQAYGAYNASLVQTMDRSVLPANITPIVGQYLTFTNTGGGVSYLKIINVTPTSFTWDENNELAGENLTFQIRLVGIK